tara:strand:- start:66 stop:518 length:453 start_codon:yes stop_codon:yes gene_type:complete
MEKMLYFRCVADADNDDGQTNGATNPTSLMVPASKLIAMGPDSATTLELTFENINNQPTTMAGASTEEILTDTVLLLINEHKHKEVMDGIIRAINSNHLYTDGFIVVADTVTTNVANETVSKVFVHPDITGFKGYSSDTDCPAITVNAAV